MKKLAIALAVGAAALMGGSAANAADNAVKAKAGTELAQTDFSSHRRHYRHRYRVVHRVYRPYYRSYGYVPAPVYAPAPVYFGGGPIISFGFGGGGWHGGGWGHHRHHHHHHRHW